ncbi:hypothetical protein PFLmoz3_06235 [Pseudomonas fluorescens]|uniref:Uncharacterized protein n=1 Tax=Pseudomonas fluorescens TaxID=294 RepID=A0A120FXG3_PSEFL|nr:hypothetical protein PFLmoz3_06235 [Pseudomonas fluorescens]
MLTDAQQKAIDDEVKKRAERDFALFGPQRSLSVRGWYAR